MNRSGSKLLVSVGEVLWDLFPEGARFGGAPANVACHTVALGGRAALVSAVGQDELGERALEQLERRGVETQAVERLREAPTGTVDVKLGDDKKATYEFAADVAWDRLQWNSNLQQLAGRADAVCFGTLGQRDPRSRAVIERFLDATPPTTLRILDINLRPPFTDRDVISESLQRATILKLNDEELEQLAPEWDVHGSIAEQLKQLTEQFQLRAVALTRGAGGSSLLLDGVWHELPSDAIEINDTVGAGDAFTAGLVLGIWSGVPVDAIHRRANRVAAYVCTQPGATPDLPDEIVQLFHPSDSSG